LTAGGTGSKVENPDADERQGRRRP
jgi:hypothetical protein